MLFMLILLQWIKKAEFELGILSHKFSTNNFLRLFLFKGMCKIILNLFSKK